MLILQILQQTVIAIDLDFSSLRPSIMASSASKSHRRKPQRSEVSNGCGLRNCSPLLLVDSRGVIYTQAPSSAKPDPDGRLAAETSPPSSDAFATVTEAVHPPLINEEVQTEIVSALLQILRHLNLDDGAQKDVLGHDGSIAGIVQRLEHVLAMNKSNEDGSHAGNLRTGDLGPKPLDGNNEMNADIVAPSEDCCVQGAEVSESVSGSDAAKHSGWVVKPGVASRAEDPTFDPKPLSCLSSIHLNNVLKSQGTSARSPDLGQAPTLVTAPSVAPAALSSAVSAPSSVYAEAFCLQSESNTRFFSCDTAIQVDDNADNVGDGLGIGQSAESLHFCLGVSPPRPRTPSARSRSKRLQDLRGTPSKTASKVRAASKPVSSEGSSMTTASAGATFCFGSPTNFSRALFDNPETSKAVEQVKPPESSAAPFVAPRLVQRSFNTGEPGPGTSGTPWQVSAFEQNYWKGRYREETDLHSISAMAAYEDFSAEELRFQDYQRGNLGFRVAIGVVAGGDQGPSSSLFGSAEGLPAFQVKTASNGLVS